MRLIQCGLLQFGAMFLKSQLYDQLWTIIRSNPNSSSIQTSIETLKPIIDYPVQNLHSHTLESLRTLHGKAVCLRMMIQDTFETQYYSAAFTKSGKIQSREDLETKVILNKYQFNVQSQEEIENQQYKDIIFDRQVYRAVIPKGQTQWVTKINGGGDINSVILRCYHKEGFKLGQIVNVVGILDFEITQKQQIEFNNFGQKGVDDYYPIDFIPRINVISVLNQKQIKQYNLDYKLSLQKIEINFVNVRESIMKLFQKFSSKRYSQFLLYSLVNTQRMSMYLSGENLEPLLKQLLPFLVKVEVKTPFKEQLFPKKNDIMKDSLLQLSDQNTYVIIDFTNIGEGKIQGEQVLNIELLKKFAEQGQILYRWEIGQSLVTKNTSGIIAKGSAIIQPTFNLIKQSINLQNLPELTSFQQNVQQFRAYIHQVQTLSQQVVLSSDFQKTLIQKDFVQQRQLQGKLTPQTFTQRLMMCRLQAALLGQTEITYKIYQKIKEITQ